jgi:hypothetical protein
LDHALMKEFPIVGAEPLDKVLFSVKGLHLGASKSARECAI